MQLSEPSLHLRFTVRIENRVVLRVVGFIVALVVCATASAELTPSRTFTAPASITAVSVAGRSISYAVGETSTSCGYVGVWEPTLRFRVEVGHETIVGCKERPSGGFGIPSVSVAGRRVFWLTHIGGNISDWRLWTATPTRRSPRLLATASAETDCPPPIVLGAGTPGAVPYAVGDTVTLIAASGARLFRASLGSPVRLLTAGRGGAGRSRVLAALGDGRVVLLSDDGRVLRSETFAPDTVRAIALGVLGPVVQTGDVVQRGSIRVERPEGARMLDHHQGTIEYRYRRQIRSRDLPTGADHLLLTLSLRPLEGALFASDNWGGAWATGRVVSWTPWIVADP